MHSIIHKVKEGSVKKHTIVLGTLDSDWSKFNLSENEFNLLAPIMENKSQTLMKAIDSTNTKYGRNSISIAQAGVNNSWKIRREHFSKIDTASFNSLPMLKI